MTIKMSRVKAYQALGTNCANPFWGWSGRSDDGQKVALLFWYDKFGEQVSYDDAGWGNTQMAKKRGNKRRMKDIQHALDHLSGMVHVVVGVAKDPNATDRKIKHAYPKHDYQMKVTHFDQITGEWRAERVPASISNETKTAA